MHTIKGSLHQCAVGTMKCQQCFSFSFGHDVCVQYSLFHGEGILGMKHHVHPSSDSYLSSIHFLRSASLLFGSTSFFVSIHSWQAANKGSSICASLQSVTCMGFSLRACIGATLRARAWTTSFRRLYSSWRVRFASTSPLSVAPVTAPSSRDCTPSLF